MFHLNIKSNYNTDLAISWTFRHYRATDFEIRPKKSVTDVSYCVLTVNGVQFTGLAACAQGDTFNKDIGRKVALTRAMKDAKLEKYIRTEIWSKYFNRGHNNDVGAVL
jgi:hypothetical protein